MLKRVFALFSCMSRAFSVCLSDEEEEEDPVAKAEEEFWDVVNQEKKAIESRESKRQEALLPKHQPTPIPEEASETPTG